MSAPASAARRHGPEPVARGTAVAGGVRIAWRAHGEGEPVVMVMGFMGSGYAWFRLLPHIARSYRAVVLDNRGTGDSDRPGGRWSMADLAGDVLAVMDDAGIDSAHVVGASMGGMIVQHLALGHPERVRSLTLCCTHPGGQGLRPPQWRMAASLALRPVLGPTGTFPIVAPLLYASRTLRDEPERVREDLAMRARDATPIATAVGQVAAISGHDTRRRLGALRMPVLIVHGEEDRLIPVSAAHQLKRLLPSARLVLIPDCGHVLTTDAEEQAAGAILEFLASVSAAGDWPRGQNLPPGRRRGW